MAEPSRDIDRRVLHVHPPSLKRSTEIAGAIAEAGCLEVLCPDVYRALARLGRAGPDRIEALIVCVDRLETAEFEFFQLTARHHRDVGVYVYGGQQAGPKIETALHFGARQAVGAEELAVVLKPSAEFEPAVQALADTAGVGEGEDSPTVDEPAAKRRKSSDHSMRVPWLRYEDTPRRTPPKRTVGKPGEVEPIKEDPDTPLLSPEELEALMGDEDGKGSKGGRGPRRRRS